MIKKSFEWDAWLFLSVVSSPLIYGAIMIVKEAIK